MRKTAVISVILFFLALGTVYCFTQLTQEPPSRTLTGNEPIIELPEPRQKSGMSIEETLIKRRSIREYSGEPLTLQELSQLLWACQGVTDPRGYRTAPSAGALYPLEIYVVTGEVESLIEGVYKYSPQEHQLTKIQEGDKRPELSRAALRQTCVEEAAVDIIITAVYKRTTVKYGDRGVRYVHIETGHAAQNLCLQAAALDLGVVTVGAFQDDEVKEILGLLEDEQPLYIIPVGRK